MVCDGVKGWGIVFSECGMRVSAVQTLLIAIDHGFPIESPLVGYAASVRKFGEIHLVDQRF